jgi:hypothetical protein
MEKFKLVVILSLVFIVISACKKDSTNDNPYYIDVTIDGNKTDFSTGVSAHIYTAANATIISGSRKPTIDQLTFILTNFSGNQLITGTYPGQTVHLSCQFNDNSLSLEYKNIIFSSFSISVNSINNTYVAVSFSGRLYSVNNFADSINFTGGKFKVPFLR